MYIKAVGNKIDPHPATILPSPSQAVLSDEVTAEIFAGNCGELIHMSLRDVYRDPNDVNVFLKLKLLCHHLSLLGAGFPSVRLDGTI
jgi:hypothetical protein